MAPRTWTCQRQTGGVVCKAVNPKRRQICQTCGKKRPPSKTVAHDAARVELSYEECVKIFGEECMICGAKPKPGKNLQRDHEHVGFGHLRGLLCFQCNIMLKDRHTLVWMRSALDYLERAEKRKEGSRVQQESHDSQDR